MLGNSAADKFGHLSRDKRHLLRLLLKGKVSQSQDIPCYERHWCDGLARVGTSWGQRRLWFIDRLEGGSAAYNIPTSMRLRGALDRSSLKRALQRLVQRHEVLRTSFVEEGGEPKQVIAFDSTFSLKEFDLTEQPPGERERHVRIHASEEANEPFNLAQVPLIRGRLLRLAELEHVLLITAHHVVFDGWSIAVMIRELAVFYGACRADASQNGPANPLPPLSIQYADYVRWQSEWLKETLGKQLQYWVHQLAGAPPEIELPLDRVRPTVQSYRGANIELTLDEQLTSALRKFAQREHVTLFMVLYAAYALLLSRLASQDEVIIGTPIANRQRPQLEPLIGLFVNTLALRVKVDSRISVRDYVALVKNVTLEGYEHQDAPFESVVEALKPERSLSRHPLFQVMFALQNVPKAELRLPGITIQQEKGVDEPAMFDMLLALEEKGDSLYGTVNYATDLFDIATIERWIGYYKRLVWELVLDASRQLGELPMLPDVERRLVLETFNATNTDYPRDNQVHELFERRVERDPQAIAVLYQQQSLTYADLNAKANQLAHFLKGQGVQIGENVPIVMSRSVTLVIAQLAVLKSGAVYVPIDRKLPTARQTVMIRDCNARRILSDGPCGALEQELALQWINIPALSATLSRLPEINLARVPGHGLAPAYIMFTSGSTGTPKGVVVCHRGIVRLAINNGYAVIEPTDCIAHSSNPIFDASTFEIWATLINGARMLIVPQETVLDAQLFMQELLQHQVSILFLTTGLFTQYSDKLSAVFSQLRYLITGGDVADPVAVKRVLVNCKPQHLLNAYGPTECTTYATTCDLNSPGAAATPISIGRPIANTRVYILDEHLQPVPIGVKGELFIGGDGVALGYLNRPELTNERFIHDPFCVDQQGRLYRTGDMGRWRPDGNIQFLGRCDSQVKIRGFRIELGEVETYLAQHEAIREAAVLVREDKPSDKRLVAYVVPRITGRDARPPSAETLRTYLVSLLPEFAIPEAFVTLESIPLNASGKIDRRALPAPQLDAYSHRRYEPPASERETRLAHLWEELLGIERVGRHDNFFELGGHSLLIVQMMDRLRCAGLSADIRQVFESPTLKDLALAVAEHSLAQDVPANLIPKDATSITPAMLPMLQLDESNIEHIARLVAGGATNIQDIYPLAPLQEGILFHHMLDVERTDTYVLAMVLSLPTREKLGTFLAALQSVIDRHDILRSAVLWEQLPQPVQVIQRNARLSVDQIGLDWDADVLGQLKTHMVSRMRKWLLHRAPLLRVQVATNPSGGEPSFAILHLHHLIIDHESLDVLLDEIVEHMRGRQTHLSAPIPFRNHVARVLGGTRAQEAEAFFRSKLADISEPTAPFGLIDVFAEATRIVRTERELPVELSNRARARAKQLGITVATLFHAAWALVLAHTSGRDDVTFGTVLLGRLGGGDRAQRSLGLFINTLPLRLKLEDLTVTELVEHTRSELAQLLSHEQASLAVAQRCSGIGGSAPLFTALFNYRYTQASPESKWQDLGLRVVDMQDWTSYPITVSVDDMGETFSIMAQTDRCIDPERMIEYLSRAVHGVVESLDVQPARLALALPILPPKEQHLLCESFNATREPYPQDRLVHDVFEDQARRTPSATAVIHGEQLLSYGELNQRANRLANHLSALGVGRGDLVAICVHRGIRMVVGLLGILKSGAAYIPLDPNYPPDRLKHMLTDGAPRLILTQRDLVDTLPQIHADVILLDDPTSSVESQSLEDHLPAGSTRSAQDLVYVIYTSGSTGLPKGTAMPHRAMVNLIEWQRQVLRPNEGQRVIQFAALSFDVAFQETFTTLCTGGTLVLLDESVRKDPRALLGLINRHGVTRLFVPPLMLQSLAESCHVDSILPRTLQDVITAGEQLHVTPEIINFFSKLDGCRLHNHYGPTETHVVTALTLKGDPASWDPLPTIGRPISNSRLYVLDARCQLAPLGVIGEIYIGGACVARGYLNREELTQQRFIPDPFSSDPKARLYKTGDLGKWGADGNLEYLGRNDDQVKIRGYRIELGEIQVHLARHPRVKDAAVIAREDRPGDKRLVAYITAREGQSPEIDELRGYLKDLLPDHMIPGVFVLLGHFPLSPNGKLDRRALPIPDMRDQETGRYTPPQGETEQKLTRIWQTLLHVEQVGSNSNFFELGGHSLHAMRLNVKVREHFSVNLAVTAIFSHPTVRELAALIEPLRTLESIDAAQPILDSEEGVI